MQHTRTATAAVIALAAAGLLAGCGDPADEDATPTPALSEDAMMEEDSMMEEDDAMMDEDSMEHDDAMEDEDAMMEEDA